MKRFVMVLLFIVLLCTTSLALADLPSWVQPSLEYTRVGDDETGYWNLGSVYGPFDAGTSTSYPGTASSTSTSVAVPGMSYEEPIPTIEVLKTGNNRIKTGMVEEITRIPQGFHYPFGISMGMTWHDLSYYHLLYAQTDLMVCLRESYNRVLYDENTLTLTGYVLIHANGSFVYSSEFYDKNGSLLLCSYRIDTQDYFAIPEHGWLKGTYDGYQRYISGQDPETDFSRSVGLYQPVTDGNILNKLNAVKNFGQTGTTAADDTQTNGQTDGQTTVNVTNVYVTNVTQVVSSGDGTTQANNQVPQDGSQFVNTWQQISGKWYYYGSDGTVQKNGWIGEYYLTDDGSMAVNQWIDGKWYVGADGKWVPDAKPQSEESTATASNEETVSAEKGTWMQEGKKWWFQKDDGSYVANAWAWIDGDHDGYAECYYFDDSGYMAVNRKIGTYRVNKSGAWTVKGVVQRMKVQ